MQRALFAVVVSVLVAASACATHHDATASRAAGARSALQQRNVSSKQSRPAIATPTRRPPPGLIAAAASADAPATAAPVPTCDATFVSRNGDLSFDCPSGWFLWDDLSGSDEGLVIIANRPPLQPGGDGLPEGWLKVDLQITPKDEAPADQLPTHMCDEPVPNAVTISCGRIDIAGRSWVSRVARDEAAEYHSVTTEMNGWVYTANAIIPLGSSSDEGREIISSLYETLRVRARA